jgi:hypothetical protein
MTHEKIRTVGRRYYENDKQALLILYNPLKPSGIYMYHLLL